MVASLRLFPGNDLTKTDLTSDTSEMQTCPLPPLWESLEYAESFPSVSPCPPSCSSRGGLALNSEMLQIYPCCYSEFGMGKTQEQSRDRNLCVIMFRDW